jgi:hypothetical protein
LKFRARIVHPATSITWKSRNFTYGWPKTFTDLDDR